MGCSCRTLREEHSPRPGCLPGGSPPSTPVRVPETPPGHLPLHATHSGGVFVGEPTHLTGAAGAAIRKKVSRHRLERSPLRRRYFSATTILFNKGEVNDKPRSNRCRNGGHLGFTRLGGGGKCTSQYQPERLPR